MQGKTICSICENIIITTYYSCEHILEEEYVNCKKCGYYYEYIFGIEREYIGNKFFYRSWTQRDYYRLYKRYKKAKFMARRRWKKYKKGTTMDFEN